MKRLLIIKTRNRVTYCTYNGTEIRNSKINKAFKKASNQNISYFVLSCTVHNQTSEGLIMSI